MTESQFHLLMAVLLLILSALQKSAFMSWVWGVAALIWLARGVIARLNE